MNTHRFVWVVVDENVPREVVESLRDLGLKEVYWIAEHKSGISDPEVWEIATARRALLITGDLRVLPQLDETDILHGPDVLEYSTKGFSKNELQDPKVMKTLVGWFFLNGHHQGKQHAKILVEGTVSTRRQLWHREKERRRRNI